MTTGTKQGSTVGKEGRDGKEVWRRLETCHGFCAAVANTFPVNPKESSPSHKGANAWMLVALAYTGLEQGLKAAAIASGRAEEIVRKTNHDLLATWRMVPQECQDEGERYYREWVTAMTLLAEKSELPETAREFIEHIGKGYESAKPGQGYISWRYWPSEPKNEGEMPTLHDGPMLEIWLGIVDWINKVKDRDEGIVRGSFNHSIAERCREAWYDAAETYEAESEAGGTAPWWNEGPPRAFEAGAVLWHCAAGREIPAKWSRMQREGYAAWARAMREYADKGPGEESILTPYDNPHIEAVKAWIRICQEAKVMWDEGKRKWALADG